MYTACRAAGDPPAHQAGLLDSFACVRARDAISGAVHLAAGIDPPPTPGVAAPKAEIIVIGVWNDDLNTTRQSDPLYRRFDLTIARAAAGRMRVLR